MPPSDSPSSRRWHAVLLVALVAYGPISIDLYLPSLPSLQAALGADVAQAQLTLSAFIWGFALAQLAYGPLSDRFGRRPVLLVGLTLYVVASVACLFATTIEALVAARFVQALGACAGPVLARAVVRDLNGPLEAARIIAYMGSAMAIVPAVAPMIGGLLQVAFGWRASFALLVLFGLLTLLLTWRGLAETHHDRDPTATRPAQILRNFSMLMRDRGYRGCVLAVSFAFAGMFAFISVSPFLVMEVFGLPPSRFGLVFLVVVLGFMGGSFLSARRVRQRGTAVLLRFGAWLGVAGGLLMLASSLLFGPGLWTIMPAAGLYFLGAGFVIPNGFSGGLAPFPKIAGSASALLGFTQGVIGGAAGWLSGVLYAGSAWPMLLLLALFAVAMLAASRLTGEVRFADGARSGENGPFPANK